MAQNAQLIGMVLWPTEAESLGFANLDAIRLHVGAAQEILAALEVRTGALTNRFDFFASLPASVIARAVAAATIVTQQAAPAVAAVAAAQGQPGVAAVAAVPEITRPLGPVESSQIGTMWRISRRTVLRRNGMAWEDTLQADVDPLSQLPQAFAAPPPGPAAPGPAAPAVPGVLQAKEKFSNVIGCGPSQCRHMAI